jgi:F-type H+-transporting ATPase subunit delta
VAGAAVKRYARAIFELAREEKDLNGWGRRVERVAQALEDEGTRRLLENPSVPVDARLGALDAAAPGWDQQAKNLAKLLVGARRAEAARGVAEEYVRLVDEAEGRVQATAVTAVELPAQERSRLSKELSASLGREVRLDVKVDPSIIGGLVLQFGDSLIDASVATRLQQLRRRLATA